jgi:hypothetical protein
MLALYFWEAQLVFCKYLFTKKHILKPTMCYNDYSLPLNSIPCGEKKRAKYIGCEPGMVGFQGTPNLP